MEINRLPSTGTTESAEDQKSDMRGKMIFLTKSTFCPLEEVRSASKAEVSKWIRMGLNGFVCSVVVSDSSWRFRCCSGRKQWWKRLR